ncbi:VOC family protein [Haloactinomyces albus]|uniref:Catechol 2,3-dioxygenase-like lactoylglutathione lyase family enzyme n=1 Tax=Haloactinomyces albus TaxID=1352928 RepID=A0AAE3ZDE4_9ACTN|nr:VOC family protein [Haloactinomyces albus]MDR7301207.1 catechol 2,3-dioxygenase-like lactoylglutathione lyase family enzyme [Haloactinomyces albus]
MTILFNHTIIAARDKQQSASFFTEIFDLPPAEPGGFFLVVRLDGGVLLQFAEPGIEFPPQHYAFLVTEDDFDNIYARIRAAGIEYSADPQGKLPRQYNTNHGGRGIYFHDPSGHYLEAITQPYGADTAT